MRPRSCAVLALAVLSVAACGDATGPVSPALDEASVARIAEAVSEAADVRLPSLGALLRASREAIQAQGGHDEAVAHFRRAHRLRAAAEDAHEAGLVDEARRLERRAYRETLAGIVSALGPDAVADAVAGSVAGLHRVHERIEGRELPDWVARAVQRLESHVSAAEASLAGGNLLVALHHSLTAADGIRALSPRYAARRWIQRATDLLRAAREAVAAGPTEAEIATLRRAFRLLNLAKDELEAGHPLRSLEAARRSAHLSWGVLQERGG